MKWWVWWQWPGYPHLHANDYGGQSCATQKAALKLLTERVQQGYIVKVYAA